MSAINILLAAQLAVTAAVGEALAWVWLVASPSAPEWLARVAQLRRGGRP